VGWYFNTSYSWGFVRQGNTVSRNSCDTDTSGADAERMCWHTGSNTINSGWRCGTTTDLNGDASWERLIYHTSM
jgi:hypothetical protein